MNTGGYDVPQDSSQSGGTATANGFTINIPTFSAGGTAFGLNFDFGATPAQIASQAYDFLNTSFSNDQGFLNASISGTQNFLSHQIAPILSADQTQINQNAQVMPSLYNGIGNATNSAISAINQNTAQGIAAQQATAQASINASANAGGGGGCFITTAVCEYMNFADDCEILTKLRAFRDHYMLIKHPDEVTEYYERAPVIVEKLNARKDRASIYILLLNLYILPAIEAIDSGANEKARAIYAEGCAFAKCLALESAE